MSISAVNNSQQNNKLNVLLSTVGGSVWAAKEIYNTHEDLTSQKSYFRSFLKGFYNKGLRESDQKLCREELERARLRDKIFPSGGFEERIKKIIEESELYGKSIVKEYKNKFKTNIKKIKRYAPLKIAAKFLGGAAIGLGLSYLISYFKKD